MRVTQRTIYSSIISYNNKALSDLQESNLQSLTEKRVNRPSDDPAGTANIYTLRSSLEDISRYTQNANTAKGWLTLADGMLQEVSNLIITAKGKDLQGATGTVSPENREQIAVQLREIYEQLIVAANSTYADQYIFAGHKTDTPPYEHALSAVSSDKGLAGVDFEVLGDSKHSVVVQFLEDGDIGTDGLRYRYSSNSGKTWTEKVLAAGSTELDLDGVTVRMHDNGAGGNTVTGVDPDNDHETDNGTWVWVYPTAQYKGDDDGKIWVDSYGASGVSAKADGAFAREVAVRIDSVAGGALTYSYTTDAGKTWATGNSANITGGNTRLLVPGGYLNLDIGAGTLAANDQFFIRSSRADMKLDIAQGESLTINNIGKNVFGGIYQDPSDKYPKQAFDGDGRNLMDTIGKLVCFAENNNQEGFQKELANLEKAHNVILTSAASVGGRLDRAAVAKRSLEVIGDSETQALSGIEDVDFIELMNKISKQELIYQSVLKSSSMMMQFSLLNFI